MILHRGAGQDFRRCCLRDSHRSHVFGIHSCGSNARRLPENPSAVAIYPSQMGFRQRGATFVELLVALSLLSVVGVGMTSSIIKNIRCMNHWSTPSKEQTNHELAAEYKSVQWAPYQISEQQT